MYFYSMSNFNINEVKVVPLKNYSKDFNTVCKWIWNEFDKKEGKSLEYVKYRTKYLRDL